MEITADITATGVVGTIVNTTGISSFVQGSFTGESISYEEYTAAVNC